VNEEAMVNWGLSGQKQNKKDRLNTSIANAAKQCGCLQQLRFGVQQMHTEFSRHCKLLNKSTACHSLSVQTKTIALSTNTLFFPNLNVNHSHLF
jgi:hypothetical protein